MPVINRAFTKFEGAQEIIHSWYFGGSPTSYIKPKGPGDTQFGFRVPRKEDRAEFISAQEMPKKILQKFPQMPSQLQHLLLCYLGLPTTLAAMHSRSEVIAPLKSMACPGVVIIDFDHSLTINEIFSDEQCPPTYGELHEKVRKLDFISNNIKENINLTIGDKVDQSMIELLKQGYRIFMLSRSSDAELIVAHLCDHKLFGALSDELLQLLHHVYVITTPIARYRVSDRRMSQRLYAKQEQKSMANLVGYIWRCLDPLIFQSTDIIFPISFYSRVEKECIAMSLLIYYIALPHQQKLQLTTFKLGFEEKFLIKSSKKSDATEAKGVDCWSPKNYRVAIINAQQELQKVKNYLMLTQDNAQDSLLQTTQEFFALSDLKQVLKKDYTLSYRECLDVASLLVVRLLPEEKQCVHISKIYLLEEEKFFVAFCTQLKCPYIFYEDGDLTVMQIAEGTRCNFCDEKLLVLRTSISQAQQEPAAVGSFAAGYLPERIISVFDTPPNTTPSGSMDGSPPRPRQSSIVASLAPSENSTESMSTQSILRALGTRSPSDSRRVHTLIPGFPEMERLDREILMQVEAELVLAECPGALLAGRASPRPRVVEMSVLSSPVKMPPSVSLQRYRLFQPHSVDPSRILFSQLSLLSRFHWRHSCMLDTLATTMPIAAILAKQIDDDDMVASITALATPYHIQFDRYPTYNKLTPTDKTSIEFQQRFNAYFGAPLLPSPTLTELVNSESLIQNEGVRVWIIEFESLLKESIWAPVMHNGHIVDHEPQSNIHLGICDELRRFPYECLRQQINGVEQQIVIICRTWDLALVEHYLAILFPTISHLFMIMTNPRSTEKASTPEELSNIVQQQIQYACQELLAQEKQIRNLNLLHSESIVLESFDANFVVRAANLPPKSRAITAGSNKNVYLVTSTPCWNFKRPKHKPKKVLSAQSYHRGKGWQSVS